MTIYRPQKYVLYLSYRYYTMYSFLPNNSVLFTAIQIVWPTRVVFVILENKTTFQHTIYIV